MKGKIRVTWLLLTAFSLLLVTIWGPRAAASGPASTTTSATTEIDGPLHLTVEISPAVAAPRDTLTLTLILTNRQEQPANPELSLHLPAALSHRGLRFPTSTTFNYRENVLTWLPLLPAGESVRLTLPFSAAVADLTHPEQTVAVILHDGDREEEAVVSFWSGLPPAASVSAHPAVVAVGQPVRLQAHVAGAGPFTQSWALGDGRHLSASDPVVVYARPGTYEVTLRAANPLGVATATGTVTVIPQPAASFAVDDPLPVVQQVVHFTDESGGQPPLGYRWEFGDGAVSTERHPTHRYAAPGSYEVRLLVESEHGQAETTRMLTVGSNPTADFVVDDTAVTGRPFQGRAYTDGTVTAIRWEMGDGATYETESVSHVYRRAGQHQVTMTVVNEFGETRVTRPIDVEQGAVYLFLPQVTHLFGGPTVQSSAPAEAIVITVPESPPAPAPAPASPAPTPAPTPAANVVVESVEPSPAPAPPQSAAPAEPPAAAQQPTQPVPPAAPPAQFQPIALPPQPPLDPATSPAEQLLWYVNEARRLHGLPPLAYNYQLSIAAQMHTTDMAGNPEIMHDGTDGSRPAERQRRYGYPGAYGGEAVAWGWESAVPVVEFWVNSPPHRALILNPAATEVGVGFTADGTAPNLWYWAAEFGIRREE